MKITKLKKRLKDNDGGTIKFKDRYRRKTYYFDVNYESSLPALKRMNKRTDFILLFSSDENHQIFESVEEVQDHLHYSKEIMIGSIICLDNTYAIADKSLALELFTNIMIPNEFEKYLSTDEPVFDNNINYDSESDLEPIISKTKAKKSYSIFSVTKPISKPRFDWNDAYLEGLRIHGNIDDAESHADDEEYKYKKSIR